MSEVKINHNKSLDVIYSVCKEKIDIQMQQRANIESKANSMIGFAGVIFALLVTAIDTIKNFSSEIKILLFIGIIFFGISVILAIITSWVRRYYFYPNIDVLFQKYNDMNPTDTKVELVNRFINDWQSNAKILNKRGIILQLAYFFELFGFIFFLLAILLSI